MPINNSEAPASEGQSQGYNMSIYPEAEKALNVEQGDVLIIQ